MIVVITGIQVLCKAYTLVVFLDVIFSFFLSPYHKIRYYTNMLVEPPLRQIRKVVKPFSGFDFSPLILIFGVQIIEFILVSLLSSIGSR